MLQIYITDLAAYHQGFLVGEHISLPKEEPELIEDINRILGKGERVCNDFPHEEVFITDFEWNDIEIFKIGEFDNIQKLNQKISLLSNEVEEQDYIKIKFLLENSFASSLEESIEKLDNVIYYPDTTMIDIAEEYIENCYNLNDLPEIIQFHIDYAGIARDLEINGSFFQENSDIFEYLD